MGFLGFDSLDALRVSIAARFGQNASGRDVREDLSPLIGRLLLDEARENERRIASLRVVLALVYFALAVGSSAAGLASVSVLARAAAAAWSVTSAGLYVALRRGWYRNWLRRVMPTADALAIVAGAALAGDGGVSDASRGGTIGNAALMCAVLIFTGALRLTRLSTLYSSILATVAFVLVAAQAGLTPLSAAGVVAGLLASSLLAGRVTEVIRRVIGTEVGRLEMERQVDRANARVAEAQAASAAREEVLRIVAHDLRNPLSTLLMSAELMAEPSMNDEWRAKQAGVMQRTGARMNRLIRDLLDVARMESGRLAIEARPIGPEQLIAIAVDLMRPLAEERSLSLDVTPASSLPEVSADAERIGQVFSNLIGNAIKFTPAGGRIVLGADLADGQVWFSVTDTGPGIPPEQLEKIFGPFWQARRADSRGIGLGLTIAKGIVEAHGGTIGVSSELGVGTRFWFGMKSAEEPTRVPLSTPTRIDNVPRGVITKPALLSHGPNSHSSSGEP